MRRALAISALVLIGACAPVGARVAPAPAAVTGEVRLSG